MKVYILKQDFEISAWCEKEKNKVWKPSCSTFRNGWIINVQIKKKHVNEFLKPTQNLYRYLKLRHNFKLEKNKILGMFPVLYTCFHRI